MSTIDVPVVSSCTVSPMNRQTRWNTYLTALQAYAATHGHARVPAGYVYVAADDVEGARIQLGAWVGYVRQRYRSGRLTPERIAQLNDIPGWEWGPLRPGPRTDETRNAEILRLRTEQNLSLQKIADIYGLSRQRIHQVLKQGTGVTHDAV